MSVHWLATVLVVAIPSALQAQGLDYLKANYTKYEYRIPMRDGKQLFTAVYTPKDDSKTYPILLIRTPYSVPSTTCDFKGRHAWLSAPCWPVLVKGQFRGCREKRPAP